jgi:hypothetical protein
MSQEDCAEVGHCKLRTEKPPVMKEVEMFDPFIAPPPRGVNLLLINPGGVLIKGPWTDDCLAWMPHPSIPASVKKRQYAKKGI